MKNNRTDKKKISYRLIVVFAVMIVVLTVGSILSINILVKNIHQMSDVENGIYSRHYAFIRTDENKEFWNDVYSGAVEKGKSLGVYVEDFGENLTVSYSTNELLRLAIEASVDGIIVYGDYDEESAGLIDEAAMAGIPTVTVMDDCVDSGRICYVGISSYAMGRQYGDRMVRHMSQDGSDNMLVYIIMNSGHSENGSALVVSGILDVFSELGYGNNIDIEPIYVDGETTFSIEENIRDIFLRDELPDAIVGSSAVHTRCLFQAAVDYNKVGDVLLYGFDDSEEILDAVSKNIVEATLSVNTQEMGGICVEALDEYVTTGYVSEYLSQDTELILEKQANWLLEAYENESE